MMMTEGPIVIPAGVITRLHADGEIAVFPAADEAQLEQAAAAERARVVKWLRAEAQTCDCFAYDESECACGAWDSEPGERSYKRANIEDLADKLEALAHLKEGPE